MARTARISTLVAAALLLVARAHAAPADDAAAVIERLYSALVTVATTEPAPALGQRVEALAPVIESTHDLATMGRITVRRFWTEWDEAQRERFLDAFERLSVTTYASRFAGVRPGTFAVLGAEAVDENRVEVDAVIRRRDAGDVTMDYLLQLDDTGWRIVNVEADGVSELSLMRSKYFAILDSGDLDDLIGELEAEIAAL
ncbi:MAG TPA: ABC transporter substrate-binding protein [Gammaproteobacteria bacterium]|nr:ABC transporter substrate-binding protein [Gammaproteobacteria bacterium]